MAALTFSLTSHRLQKKETNTNTFSAMELQHQPGHKPYQPIWEMPHKLRGVRGKPGGRYTLNGNAEIGEGLFTTEVPEDKKDEAPQRGVNTGNSKKYRCIPEGYPLLHLPQTVFRTKGFASFISLLYQRLKVNFLPLRPSPRLHREMKTTIVSDIRKQSHH